MVPTCWQRSPAQSLVYRIGLSSAALWLILPGSRAPAAADSGTPVPDGIEVQRRCLEERERNTKEGYLTLRKIREGSDGRTESQLKLWFSGPKLRCDVRHQQPGQEWTGWEHYIVNETSYIWVPEGEYEGAVAPLSEFADQPGGVLGHFSLFHPRWIGMGQTDESLLQREPLSRFVSERRTTARMEVTAEELAGWQTWKVTTQTSFPGATPDSPRHPGEFVLWVAPDAAWNLVRAELREFAPAGTQIRRVEAQLKQYPDEGLWFPERVVRSTFVNDRVVQSAELIVDEGYLGKPPPSGELTLRGLPLPEGKSIGDRTRGPTETGLVWDGQDAVPVRGPDANVELEAPRDDTLRWVWVSQAVVFLLLAAGTTWRWFRIRRPAPPVSSPDS